MIYDEPSGRRLFRALRGRRPVSDEPAELSDEERAAVFHVAWDHPHWGPRQVWAELRVTGHDIPLTAIEYAFADWEES